MAGSKGTFDKLTDWFFMHQDELSPATVRTAAKDVGGIADFDARYDKAIQEVKTEASVGAVLGVTSTPTFFINGRRSERRAPDAVPRGRHRAGTQARQVTPHHRAGRDPHA